MRDIPLRRVQKGESVLGELVDPYIRGRVRRGEIAPLTARSIEPTLRHFAALYGRRPVSNLSPNDVERWLEEIGHLSPATRRIRFSALKGWMTWLVDKGHLKRHPMARMKAPRKPRHVPRALPDEAVSRTIAAAPDTRGRLIVVLMVQEGLRRAEVARLQIGDVDFAARVMRVVGKGDNERMLPITDEAMGALTAYLGEFPASSGPLVRSYSRPTEGLTPTYIGDVVRWVMYGAGVKQAPRDGVSGHALRHSAATGMLRNGAHVRDVQQALGHRSLQTTETYLPHLVGTLGKAMNGRRYT